MSLQSEIIHIDPSEVLAHLRNIFGPDFNISGEHLHAFIHDLKKLIRKDLKRERRNLENKENTEQHCCCETEYTSSSLSISSDLETESVVPSIKTNATSVRGRQSSFIRPWRLQQHSILNPQPKVPQRSDPVTLYQKYQELWKQQKVPGEDAHAQLRWGIREKMLGHDPQPRPVYQNSTSDMKKKNNRF